MASGALSRPDDLDPLVGVAIEHRWLRRPWGDQHVVLAGEEGAPPVLLVHGWPQHWLAWRHVLTALAPTARVVAVDLRGFGWSAITSGETAHHHPSIAALAADLDAALGDLGIDRAGLVSHDWGGWIGFRAALAHPERFGSHVALGIVPPWLRPAAMARHAAGWAYVAPMAAVGRAVASRPSAVGWMLDRSTRAPIWATPGGAAARASYLAAVRRPAAAAMTQHLYRQLVRHELPAAMGPRPPRLRQPTTVVLGEAETIARPEAFWGRTHPGELRLVTVPDARHWLAEECPEAVVAAVIDAGAAPDPQELSATSS